MNVEIVPELRAPVTLDTGARTDLFIPPSGAPPTLNARPLLVETKGDFLLAATVSAEHRATFDAGALLLWRDETTWAKLAVERAPDGRAMVVSVVTRGVSDDCNSVVLPEPSARLRVARIGEECAFHLRDGRRWELVRHFTLGPGPLAAGVLCQSPTGGGTTATFSEIDLEARTLDDVRSGE